MTDTACRYEQEHPAISARLEEHDRRIGVLEKDARQDTKELWQALGRLEKTVEGVRGWISAAMIAAVLFGAIVSFIASRVLSHTP